MQAKYFRIALWLQLRALPFGIFFHSHLHFSALAFNPSGRFHNSNMSFTKKAQHETLLQRVCRGGDKETIRRLILCMHTDKLSTLTRSVDIITIQQSDVKQEIDGNVLFFAARADGEECQCEGYLIRNINGKGPVEAQIQCHGGSVDHDHFIAIYHSLLLHYLEMEQDENDAFSECGLKCFYSIADDVDLGIFPSLLDDDNDGSFSLGLDLPKYIPFLHQYSFRYRGKETGHTALRILDKLCQRRAPYRFITDSNPNIDGIDIDDNSHRSIVSFLKQTLSVDIVERVMEQVHIIRKNQWLSTNPDSVDGLPSLHLNLISDGKPLFDTMMCSNEDDYNKDEITFEKCIHQMTSILRPHLYEKLLPAVRELSKSNSVQILDVFIRNYGNMDAGDDHQLDNSANVEQEVESKTRYTLSPHYDITAFATCVMALDSTAATGRSGLYTIPPTNGVTNNVALRKFFPLDKGDGVVHTFNILHGVDVDPKLNCPRTSLIVWFTDYGGDDDDGDQERSTSEELHVNNTANANANANAYNNVNQPWLLNPSNAIDEFVLGLASECNEEEDGSHLKLKKSIDSLSLNLSSASKGNIFAMVKLGQMCDDAELPDIHYEQVRSFLEDFDPSNPFIPAPITSGSTVSDDGDDDNSRACKNLATALWYHASIAGGNRSAQISLADELMLQYMTEKEDLTTLEQENMLLMASTLFTMSLYQGYDSIDSLRRLMDVNCQRLLDLGVLIPSEEFFEDPVVKTVLLSL